MDKSIYSAKWPSQKGGIVFPVEAGGKALFASKPLCLDSPPIEVNIGLGGVCEVTLKTREINGNINSALVTSAGA
ncbi:MAG: hypothetical protein WCS96_04510 [Victivallales bacterium]